MVLAVVLAAQGVFIAWAASSPQRHAAWRGMIPSPIWPAFADLRAVTEAWDEVAAGFDPLRMDGDAPRYNYPRLWLLGSKLGGRTDDARWLGVVVAGLFLGAVFAVMRTAPGWTRLLALALMVSPAIGLGLERGNGDLLIFALVTPALLTRGAGGRWRDAWPPWVMLLAAVMKLFPIVALPACLIRTGRAVWISAAVAVLVFGGYVAATHTDIGAVLAKTERGTEESYGLTLAADKLAETPGAREATATLNATPIEVDSSRRLQRHQVARWAAGGLILAALIGAGWRPTGMALLGAGETPPAGAVRLFVGGAAIFLATFLFAHSWAYRLVFLIWTLPLLGHELHRGTMRRRVWAGTTLALIGFVCWLVAGSSPAGVWWAHAACFALIVPLVLLGSAAALPHANAANGLHAGSGRVIFAGAGLLVAVALVAGSGGTALGRSFSSPDRAGAWSLVLQGKAAAAGGRIPGAISNFEAALRLHPDYADAHAQLGSALWQAGQGEEAQRHLEQAIALQPRSIGARNTLAGVRRQQRRWDEAIKGYQESLAIRPGNVPTLNQLGLACLESGEADEAYKWLEQAKRIAPENPTTQRNLGLAAAARGRLDLAADHFERALHLRPDYADAELQWGLMLARARRLPEALVHFQRAVDLAPGSGQAHFMLAMALRELGRTSEGEPHFQEAIRLEPSLAPR